MQSPAPLPHVDITDTQWRLLAQVVAAPLPRPEGNAGAAAEEVAARGLDPDQVRADWPVLLWLKFLARQGELLAVTDLGTAMHYRALYESSEQVLGEIAQLVEEYGATAPEFARAVGGLSRRAMSFADASASLRGDTA
ncbi:hypothetical protein QFZ82_001683 [Streptomyces sp. V4I23]|uniref:hypothetical protein n=1 Tax=Streptomyces sp. V4I23 TaxID=3042282 RepID=UPI00277D3B66|nr:hypothetical protein [Streptomyces sp. V4I23]MDQ1007198.1 hypothetical protein [Streptomyces sp. V4I23]